ncbi:MAG: ABC transporter ATP-binding protein [Bacteroidota bacterium]
MSKAFRQKDGNVVDQVDLSMARGMVVSVLGESGSGKTTFARLIAGLEIPDSGSILLSGHTVSDASNFIPPEQRQIGMVFQDYALFPHMTVFENVAYGIQKGADRKQRVNEVLELVGLEKLTSRYPHQLSGGQQQRVALARAMAPEPQLLLLDEPFSNLDASLKRHLLAEVFEIIRKSQVTAMFLTHDTQDAMAVADSIVVLKDGRLVQQGTAHSLYEQPKSPYIASLFGPIVELGHSNLSLFNYNAEQGKTYAIRQHQFQVDGQLPYAAEVSIEQSTFLGSNYLNKVRLLNGEPLHFTSDSKPTGNILLGFQESSLLIFEN